MRIGPMDGTGRRPHVAASAAGCRRQRGGAGGFRSAMRLERNYSAARGPAAAVRP